jgi:hypothetical protein
MAHNVQNFSIHAGEDCELEVTSYRNGALVDLTGSKVEWFLRKHPTSKTALLTKTSTPAAGIVIGTPPSNGKFTVTLAKADSLTLLGVYAHGSSVVDGATKTFPILHGYVTIHAGP